jgi:hypothetical protein
MLFVYASGATGVIQAATAFQPGYPRLEIHGTQGTAIITGDKLTTWDVTNDSGEEPPLIRALASGAWRFHLCRLSASFSISVKRSDASTRHS